MTVETMLAALGASGTVAELAESVAQALRDLHLVDPDDDTMPVFWPPEEDGHYDDSRIRHWTSTETVAQKIAQLLTAPQAPSEASP